MRINRLFNKTNSAVREIAVSLTKKSLQPEKLQFLMLQTCFCIRINGLSRCRLVFVFSYEVLKTKYLLRKEGCF